MRKYIILILVALLSTKVAAASLIHPLDFKGTEDEKLRLLHK